VTQPNVFPVLRYRNARAAFDWLIQAFGFQKHVEHAQPDGTIAHAELRFGPSTVGISSRTAPVPENPWSSVEHGIYVCVDNVDSHYAQASGAGAEIAIPPRDTEYGSREYTARDREGHLWGFGTYPMGAAAGEPTIFPELHYDDPALAIRQLTSAFGFEKMLEVPGPDHTVMHAELRRGSGTVFLAPTADPGNGGSIKQLACIYVSDPDQHCRRAKAGGATIVKEPHDTPYGARFYVARDPETFVWLFGTYRPSRS
jgi:uncharacterized glyoxalase superfamily protein PhnB